MLLMLPDNTSHLNWYPTKSGAMRPKCHYHTYVVPICLRKGQSWQGKGRSTLCANDHLVQGSAGSSSCTSKGGVGCKRRRRSWLPSLWGQGSRSPHQLFLTLFPKTNIPDGFPRLLLALKTFSFKVVLRVNNLQKL